MQLYLIVLFKFQKLYYSTYNKWMHLVSFHFYFSWFSAKKKLLCQNDDDDDDDDDNDDDNKVNAYLYIK